MNALRRELRDKFTLILRTDPYVALEDIKKTDKIAAVISDFNMPQMKGDIFINLAKATNPDLPCIILTAHATKENVERLIFSGDLNRILTKPWKAQELYDTLDAVINYKWYSK